MSTLRTMFKFIDTLITLLGRIVIIIGIMKVGMEQGTLGTVIALIFFVLLFVFTQEKKK